MPAELKIPQPDSEYKARYFEISTDTHSVLMDFCPDLQEAVRMKGYIITILMKLRELDQLQGGSDSGHDIIFHWLNEIIDSILKDRKEPE